MSKTKLLLAGLGAGTIVLIGVRIFLLQSVFSGPTSNTQQSTVHNAAEQHTGTIKNNEITTGSTSPTSPSSGSVSSRTEQTGGQERDSVTYDPISIIFPPIVDEDAVAKTMQLIEAQYNVEAKWTVLDSMSTYKQAVSVGRQRDTGVDIILLPTSRTNSFHNRGYKIPFEDSLAPLFHPGLRPRVEHADYTYIPLFIDPAVSIAHTQQFPRQEELTFPDIQSSLSTARTSSDPHVPLLFGLNESDISYLETNQRLPFSHQETVFQLLLEQALYTRQSQPIRFFLNTPYRTSETVSTTSRATGEKCSYMPLLCFVAYEYTDLYFGRLTDWFIVKNNFSTSTNAYMITNFPAAETYYPVQGRGLVIKKDSPDLSSSLQRMKGYLNLSLERELPVWNQDALAADNETRQRQLIESRYAFLRPFMRNSYIVQGGLNKFDQLLEETPIIEVLNGEYNINIFLRNLASAQ